MRGGVVVVVVGAKATRYSSVDRTHHPSCIHNKECTEQSTTSKTAVAGCGRVRQMGAQVASTKRVYLMESTSDRSFRYAWYLF